jgi:hypothetical protein
MLLKIKKKIENSSFCTTYKPSLSTDFAKQTMAILHISFYNSSLVTWTVVSLTTAKFKDSFRTSQKTHYVYKAQPVNAV